MAQKYRKVDPRFWTDERVQDLNSSEELSLALYMFTGPQSNRIGLYPFMPGMAADLCKITVGRFPDVLESVLTTLDWHFYERRKVLWLPHWWRYNEPENPKVLIGNLDDLHDVPVTPLDLRFFTNLRDLQLRGWRDGSSAADTFLRTYRRKYPERLRIAKHKYPECNGFDPEHTYAQGIRQEQEQEQEQEDPTVANGPVSEDSLRGAYQHRMLELRAAGHLPDKEDRIAQRYLAAGDWDSLEDQLSEIEAAIPGDEPEEEED